MRSVLEHLGTQKVAVLAVLLVVLCGFILRLLIANMNAIHIIFIPLLIAALLMASLMASLRNYRWGWLIFAAVLPFWVLVDLRVPVGPFQIGPAALSIILVGIAFILYLFIRRKTQLPKIPLFPLVALFLIIHLLSFLHGDQEIGSKILVKLGFGILIYCLMAFSIKDTRLLEKMFKVFLISSSGVLLYLTYRYLFVFHAPFLGNELFYETGRGKNQLGLFLSLLTPIALSYAVYKRRIYSVLMALLFIIASFYTLSRGTWVSILAAIIFLLFFSKKRRSYLLGSIVLSILVVLFVTFLYPSASRPFLLERARTLVTLKEMEGGHSMTYRKELMVAGLQAFYSHPVLGTGLGNFREISSHSGIPPLVSHNDYIQILAEQGLIGGITFLILLVNILVKVLKSLKKSNCIERWLIEGIAASVVSLLVYFSFINAYDTLVVWYVFGSAATLYALSLENEVSLRGKSCN